MSLAGLAGSSRSHAVAEDEYDHAITLLDTTKPVVEQISSSLDPEQTDDTPSRRGSKASLSRRGTRGTLREELARRKYAKYQETKYNGEEQVDESSTRNEDNGDAESSRAGKKRKASPHERRLRDKLTFRSKKAIKAKKPQDYEVDILYENQRGSFFCGIPLYSSRSLLNFDPSPWQTAALKDSPVDITNAQVPDPTWAWTWKSWYVDMSHDVDEEGWEYSFSFRQGFSWHGSHPWFHSFVRRRRWLRKRVKIHPRSATHEEKGALKNAHILNADYFTIHANRNRSRTSSFSGTVTHRSSLVSENPDESDTDFDEGEITNVVELMKALKKASVDRSKVEAVKNFLEHGGDELYYLPDRMHEIMARFLYQTSRQQLLSEMQSIFDARTQHRDDHDVRGEPEEENEKRRTDSLLRAVQAADEHVKNLEYWSDIKATEGQRRPELVQEEDQSPGDGRMGSHPLSESDDNGDSHSVVTESEIKGIPKDAKVDEEPGINWYMHQDDEGEPVQSTSKGKEKAR